MPNVKGFELNLTEGSVKSARRSPHSMRILVLSDFSGRSGAGVIRSDTQISKRAIIRVDVDNFEDVLQDLTPKLQLVLPGADDPVELDFRALDDFRPESLYERMPLFRELHDIRMRLQDPNRFDAAASEFKSLLGTVSPGIGSATDSVEGPAVTPSESDAETIERLLGGSAARDSAPGDGTLGKAQDAVSELIARAVDPHIVAKRPPHLDLYLRTLEDAVGERMRSLLHAPGFQALESSWLSLHHLVTNLETDENLQVHVLDVSRQELEADLASARGDLKASGLYRLLVEQTGTGTPGGEPWSLLLGNFELGSEAPDLGLLAALGMTAASAGGPFLAAASPGLVGCSSLVEIPDTSEWSDLPEDAAAAWNAFRQSAIAPWVGLAAPRVLLRLPYGRDSERVESFEFEELGSERRHEDYLWGNPAFACGLLIGQAYTARGWSMAPGDVLDLGDLPAHVYREDGEMRLQACAEVYLTERAATAILDRGLMPLLSFKGRNMVRLARFQSIASPPAALMGSWRG